MLQDNVHVKENNGRLPRRLNHCATHHRRHLFGRLHLSVKCHLRKEYVREKGVYETSCNGRNRINKHIYMALMQW